MRRRSTLFVLAASALALVLGTAPIASVQAASNPIDHVVVLMQENRSFDTYFGQLHFEGQNQAMPEPPGTSNPNPVDPTKPPIKAFHKTDYCEVADLDHSWNGAHCEYDDGAIDGFTAGNAVGAEPTGSRTMGYND